MTFSVAAAIASARAGNVCNLPPLAYFDFRDSPMWVWPGPFDLTTPDGQVWQGLGLDSRMIDISGLEQAATLEATQFSVTLSGVDATIMNIMANEDRGDYIGRLLQVSTVFCDGNWKPLTLPYAVAAGMMGTINISRVPDQKGGGWVRKIVLPADNIFFGRGGAPYSLYTDRDQQGRFPGDTGMQFMYVLQDFEIPVPWH